MSSSDGHGGAKNGKKKKKKSKVGKVYPLSNMKQDKGSDLEELMKTKQDLAEEEPPKKDQHRKESAADVVMRFQSVQRGVNAFKNMRCGKRVVTAGSTAAKKITLVKGIDASISADPLNPNVANAELIGYFGHLATSTDPSVTIDLEYLDLMLARGANVNCTDKYGQTVLHEIARMWDPDVARFMIARGSNVNQPDMYGRTPLHVSAAVDYPEMVNVLLENGAEIEFETEGEKQTPLFYAARNDASNALRLLLKNKAKLHARDYKGRTPLLVAAELDRSETASLLLEMGALASDIDKTGHTALQVMVTKMPAVAKEGLNQFHRCDRANRKQYYDLHYLEPTPLDDMVGIPARTALQTITYYNQLELIMHPVCRELIKVKWEKFGRRGAIKQLLFNLLFITTWTVLAVSLDNPFRYEFPEDIWRLVLEICGVLLTVYQIILELKEFIDSKKTFVSWRNWRITDIEKDFRYCHPQWPQERQYLDCEINEIKDQVPTYFSEKWNLFDWFVYISLLLVTLLHVVDIFVSADGLSLATQNIFAIIIIFVWVRLMKSMRAFRAIGSYIVMLGEIATDFGLFCYLYLNFYIPYACAFWMTYGGKPNIPSMATVDQMMYSLFRITLVDEYEYNEMREENVWMAYLLLTTFLLISAILCINVLIAMLSNTFQRVYDNATAISLMQQTKIILSIEEGLYKRRKIKYWNYIRQFCSPLSMYYDDDMTTDGGDDMKLATFQIRDSLSELDDFVREEQHKSHSSNISDLRKEIGDLKKSHEKQLKKVSTDLQVVQELLRAVLDQNPGGGGGGGGGGLARTLPPIMRMSGDQPEPEPHAQASAGTPRFIGKRSPIPPSPLTTLEDPIDGTISSMRQPPYLTSPPPEPASDDRQKFQIYKKESKRQRKLRQQREEYLQQQLQSSQGLDTSTMSGQRSSAVIVQRSHAEERGVAPDARSEEDGDEEAPPESLADIVRMQSTVMFDAETEEDTTHC